MSLLTIWKPDPTATQTSPILASLLCFKSAFFNGSLSHLPKAISAACPGVSNTASGCPESTEQGEEISDDGYDPCVFDYLVHGSPHPISVYAAQGWRHQVGKIGQQKGTDHQQGGCQDDG